MKVSLVKFFSYTESKEFQLIEVTNAYTVFWILEGIDTCFSIDLYIYFWF